jgi:hypothetical protein
MRLEPMSSAAIGLPGFPGNLVVAAFVTGNEIC